MKLGEDPFNGRLLTRVWTLSKTLCLGLDDGSVWRVGPDDSSWESLQFQGHSLDYLRDEVTLPARVTYADTWDDGSCLGITLTTGKGAFPLIWSVKVMSLVIEEGTP